SHEDDWAFHKWLTGTRRPREGGDPATFCARHWIPAFAGMTARCYAPRQWSTARHAPVRPNDLLQRVPAVPGAADYGKADLAVVLAPDAGQEPVSIIRAVQLRVDAGTHRLSIRARALGHNAAAILWLVRRLCAIRTTMCGVRLVQRSRPATSSSECPDRGRTQWREPA